MSYGATPFKHKVGNVIDLTSSCRMDLPCMVMATIDAKEEVQIPEGSIGILAIRRSLGKRQVLLNSAVLPSGFVGNPSLQFANFSGAALELTEGSPVARVYIIKIS